MRRTHCKQPKAEVAAACAEPGASVAAFAVALARGYRRTGYTSTANRRRGHPAAPTLRWDATVMVPSSAGFVALPLAAAEAELRVKIRCGDTSVAVRWQLASYGTSA